MQAAPHDSTPEVDEPNSFDGERLATCQSGKPLIRSGFDQNFNSKPQTGVDHAPPDAKVVGPGPRKSSFTN